MDSRHRLLVPLLTAGFGLALLAAGCASGPGYAEPADTMHGCTDDMGYPSCAPPADMQPQYYPEYPDFEDYYYPGSGVVIVPEPVPVPVPVRNSPPPRPSPAPARPLRVPRPPRPEPCHAIPGHPCA